MKTRFFPVLLFASLWSSAQNSTVFKDDMDAIFQVNRSYVTTGLLKDYGLLLTDVSKFNGTLQSNNMATRDVWQALYSSLYSMKFNATTTLAAPGAINSTIASYATTVSGRPVINIIGLHYNYEQFKTNAATGNLVYVQNGKIYDRANRPTTPYEIKNAFCMVPQETILLGGKQVFRFRNELFFKNVNKIIGTVQADFADGSGWRTLSVGSNYTVNYTTDGLKELVFKVTYTDGTVMQSKSPAIVAGVEPTTGGCSNCRYTQGKPDSLVFPVAGFTYPAMVDMAFGEAFIYYGSTDRVLDKPLIIAEGFDANNRRSHKAMFIREFLGSDIAIDNIRKKFYEHLDENGFDLIYLNFADGGADIKRNARLLENLVQWVNANKSGNEQLIVMGVSMGGLVARYALRDMELHGLNHNTKLYGSFDSPHLGANLPLGLQAAVRVFAGMSISGVGLGDMTNMSGAMKTLSCPAAQQMLTYQWQGVGTGISVNNTPHTTFQAELDNIGLPQMWGIRKMAVASGSECGTNQGYSPNSQILRIDNNKDINYFVNWLISVVAAESKYPPVIELVPIWFQMIGNLFVTDSDLMISGEIRALPDKQVKQVLGLKIEYKKVILWGLIQKTRTLFSTSKSSTADMLPLDSSPGGLMDVRDFGALPANSGIIPVNPKFSFIPNPSALYVGSGVQPITITELNRVYTRISPPGPPYTVPFDNFFSNPLANEKHVQVTEKNGSWLFNEFKGMPQIFSCSYTCGIQSLEISISGANAICNSAEQFTLVNAPSGISPVWSISPNLNYISGQGTSTYSVGSTLNGEGWIKATVEAGCGSVVREKYIYSGPPAIGDYLVGPSTTCAFEQVSFQANGVTDVSYNWYWPNDWTYISGQFSSTLTLQAPFYSTNAQIGVYLANACGSTASPSVINVSSEDCGMYSLSISPNPTQGYLSIELKEENKTGKKIEKVEIVDGAGSFMKVWTGSLKKVELDISSLPRGFCYAKVIVNGETTTARIIIE
jgi:hypothetical protein